MAKQTEAPKTATSKFASQVNECKDPNPRLPLGSVFARNKSPQGGFVLTKKDAMLSGWENIDKIKWKEYTSDNAVFDVCYLENVRCCVIKSTPSYIEAKSDREVLDLVDWENWSDYEVLYDKDKMKICQNYLLLFLDENYKPLHKRPIHYKAHGVAGLSFTTSFLAFYQKLEDAIREQLIEQGEEFEYEDWCKTNFNSKEQLSEPWHNCSVINIKFGIKKVIIPNSDNKDINCSVVEKWEEPNKDTCENYWREELKPIIKEMLEGSSGWSRRVLAPKKQFALLPYQEEDELAKPPANYKNPDTMNAELVSADTPPY